MINLNGQMGEVRLTVEVKRANTGKVEQYELVGYLDEDKLKELQNGSDSQHGSTERSD
ncbi:hypothetical protein UFOVP503_11 [uncultured Caudovirales phage]|uniref:Uncharacterized protein n=1 Tax=uncultured Caudovirales phage TaxID=2100421 RepID=A0A6J5MH93_9CAUD|nr:hypothetical protein UFOVP503_11 [uncultured Caudovirales phage]CAB4160624.1 hypothetical protein UFOVP763_5 [uncultured Caudovirales phage]